METFTLLKTELESAIGHFDSNLREASLIMRQQLALQVPFCFAFHEHTF